jgi:5-methyltetrahydropteroyltriglutamate--homocysteine methyltransferase
VRSRPTTVRERLGGFEERPLPPTVLVGPKDPSRLGEDRRRFADFYADYFRRHPVAEGVRAHRLSVCVGPSSYVGHAAIRRDIENLQAAMAEAGVERGFLPI